MTVISTAGTAHGKVILMGEHSVVYQKPAIAVPFLDAKVIATIEPATHRYIQCDFYIGLVDEMPELLKSIQTLIYHCLELLQQQEATFSLTIQSDIPIERGMGSSAAVAVATTKALFNYFKVDLTEQKLLEIVNVAETIAHGNPSGLDALMTHHHKPFYYIKGEMPVMLEPKIDGTLVIADTGITGQTKEAVVAVKALSEQQPTQTKTHLEALENLTNQATVALEHNQIERLGQVMTKAHDHLKALTVSSEKLDYLVQTALDHHALGAKLTGGGRGGCMIALTKTKEEAEVLRHILTEAGAVRTWQTALKG